jgi:hypothetical protein
MTLIKIQTGIAADNLEKTAVWLNNLLADEYVL